MSPASFAVHAFRRVRHMRTMRLLLITICLFPVGFVFETLSSFALGRSHFAFQIFEVLGVVYSWTLISALVTLLIIGPFRPFAAFSLRGDCGQRVLNFLVAFGALLSILLLYAVIIARALA
jgi:hypothetical protein